MHHGSAGEARGGRLPGGCLLIRPFVDGDLDELLDVWYRASKVGHPFLDEEFLAAERRQIELAWLPIADTLVFEVEGHIAGFVALVGSEVGGLFVDPAHHRSGIGTALLDEARLSHADLEVNVFEANGRGRSFYEAYGFTEVGRSIHPESGLAEIHLRLAAQGPRTA